MDGNKNRINHDAKIIAMSFVDRDKVHDCIHINLVDHRTIFSLSGT